MTVADRILELLQTSSDAPIIPAEICLRLNVSEFTVYKTLTRMRAKGLICRAGYGSYHLPGQKPQQRPGRRLMWARLLQLEDRIAVLEAHLASQGPA